MTHPWARAAAAGAETMVFLEIDNDGETDTLEGASSEVAGEIAIVGFSMAEGRQTYVDVGPVEVDAGEFEFDPFGLGLRLSGLTRQLQQGDTFSMTLDFAATGPVEITVEVEDADATQHSHAGHAH